MGQQILSPQQQPSQSIIKQLSSRFDILPHPFYSTIPHMKLLVDRDTQTKYILRIITTNNESQHLRIEELINKKLANKSKYITKLEQYYFQHEKSYCGNLSKCFLLFNLQRNITLRDLYSSPQSKNYSEEELIKGFNQLTNSVVLMKNLNTPHGNISPLNVYAIDGELTLSDPWIAPESADISDKFPSPQKLLKINDRIDSYDLFASDLFSIGMLILELARRQKLQRVYKKNYTLNTQFLIQEVEKVSFPKLKELLKYILLSSQNNRIQYLNDYQLRMKLRGQVLAEEHLKQRKVVRKIHLMSGRENYAKNIDGGYGNTKPIEVVSNGFKKNATIQTGTVLPAPQIQRVNRHIQPRAIPQQPQKTHVYAVSQVQSRPFSTSANKPIVNFVSQNTNHYQMPKNSSLQRAYPPPDMSTINLPYSQYVHKYNDTLAEAYRKNQNIPISHTPSLPSYQYYQPQHTNIPQYNFPSSYTLHNKIDLNLKQHPKFPIRADTSNNITRLDHAKFNETSEAIKKLLEPINNRIQNSKHSNYEKSDVSRKIYELTPDNTKSNNPIHSNSSQSNQYAHVFDEKIKNFEMGVSNAIKNTILEIQKVSQRPQKESIKTIESKIEERSFGASNIVQKQMAKCKLIGQSQIKLPESYQPIESDNRISQYLSDSLIADAKLICEQKVSQSRESDSINIACYGVNGTVFQPSYQKNEEGDNVLNSFSNEPNDENRNTFFHGTQLESVSNLAIPQQPSSQEESFDSNLEHQDQEIQYCDDYFDNGSIYKGFKKNGERNGEGVFYYKDGGCYEGHWKNNKMSGFGKLYYQTGAIAYQGQWFADNFHGRGKLYNDRAQEMTASFNYKDFNKDQEEYWKQYIGDFNNDMKEGHGKLILSNGQYYVGEFKQDKPHGRGHFYFGKNKVIHGIWNEGKLIKEG